VSLFRRTPSDNPEHAASRGPSFYMKSVMTLAVTLLASIILGWVLINTLLMELRREIFVSVCSRQSGVYLLNDKLDWVRVAAPDCSRARTRWICDLTYTGPSWTMDARDEPFRYGGNDDLGGYLHLVPVPRVSYWRTADGRLMRMTNFAVLSLNEWDFHSLTYPTQYLCFQPILRSGR
jgi:hypothetical protein